MTACRRRRAGKGTALRTHVGDREAQQQCGRNYKTRRGRLVRPRPLDNGSTRTFERKNLGNLHVGDRVRHRRPRLPQRLTTAAVATSSGRIRVGVGGWTYEPWRDNFYPAGLAADARARVREPAAHRDRDQRHLLRTQKPASFAKWRDETPDGFVFSLKATRYRDQPARAGRGRRIDRALRRQRHRRARRQARADRLAVHADQAVRRRRLRGLPDAAAGARSAASRCAT